jgi:hypothetical protein
VSRLTELLDPAGHDRLVIQPERRLQRQVHVP